MKTGYIYNIEISTNNNEVISVPSNNFSNFYIANIDDNGDEISYKHNADNTLSANFFMINILDNYKYIQSKNYNILKNNKNITKIRIDFTNGYHQIFNLAKKRVIDKGYITNIYQDNYEIDNNLCIVITDKKIRNKKSLFI